MIAGREREKGVRRGFVVRRAVGGMGIGATDGRARGKDGRSWWEGVGRGVSGEGGGVKGKQGESVSGVDGRKRSRAADGRTGSAEQEVLTGEGTSTGARRETREEGREGCTQKAPRGLGGGGSGTDVWGARGGEGDTR